MLRSDPLAELISSEPHVVADRDGQHIYVLDGSAVQIWNTRESVWHATLPYRSDVADAFASWKHELLLVANRLTQGIDLVWVGGRRISYTVPLAGMPVAMSANRAGTRLYVAQSGATGIAVIETEQYAVVDRLAEATPGVGLKSLATSADGSRLYAIDSRGELIAISLPGGAVTFRAQLGPGAARVLATRDGRSLYVSGTDVDGAGIVLNVRAEDGVTRHRVRLPAAPAALVVAE